MTSSAELEAAASSISHDQVLLVEDDDGDALLVEELLLEVGAPVVVRRARSLNQAKALLAGSACVLLDLGLPDSQGLNGLRQLLEVEPEAAVVVLTGDTNEYLGEQAVRAGAQDYLVKGEVAGHMLHRVIRYAMERRRAEEAQRQLQAAQIHAQENARLERGLLPSPLLGDSRLRVSARCLAGGQHMLLGGDFYDVVEVADGWVHAPWAMSAAAGRPKPRSASACAWPGVRWCWPADPPMRSFSPSASCSGTSGRTTPCSPRCAWCRWPRSEASAGSAWPVTCRRCW
jgi:FixJ family two-component response regulator